MNRPSKARRIHRDRQLREGVERHVPADATLALAGRMFHRAEVLDILDRRIDAAPAVAKSRAAWLALTHAEREIMQATQEVVRDLKQAIMHRFGASPEVLADFGLTPHRKPRALTTAEQSQKIAASEATRKARHTVGPRQELAIRGVVEVAASSEGETASATSAHANGVGTP